MTAKKIVDPHYFENERPEIIALVRPASLMILDVGCGMGKLSSNLKIQNPHRKVIGIENNKIAAEEARKHLDEIVEGDIQTTEIPFVKSTFDCIIYADILEHLTNPEATLLKLKPYLKPDGYIICSIPNMRHYTAILQLLLHGWEYKDFGLFDKTHLRFFSLNSAITLITHLGFKIDMVIPRIVASNKIKVLDTLCFHKLEEFLAMQYIIRAIN
jgi:O-antigen biosynthesis protein